MERPPALPQQESPGLKTAYSREVIEAALAGAGSIDDFHLPGLRTPLLSRPAPGLGLSMLGEPAGCGGDVAGPNRPQRLRQSG